jgi:hypothetical protein
MTTPQHGNAVPGTTGYVEDTTTDDSVTTSSAKDRAANAAGTAKDEAAGVASTARDEAANVAAEARDQARNLLDEAFSQVQDQSREQARRLAGTVRTFGDDLHSMAQGSEGGIAADLARQVGDRARSLSTQLEEREPRDLLEDVKDFARRKPGTFLLGALAAGVVAGRITRGARDAKSSDAGVSTSGVGNGVAPVSRPAYAAERTEAFPTAPSEPTLGTPPTGARLEGSGDPLISERGPGEL